MPIAIHIEPGASTPPVVDLTKCTPAQKARAWCRLKEADPELAEGLQRDLPLLRLAFGHVGVEVPASYIEE